MRKISEVLRLKAANLSIREIAAGTGAARTSVHEYLVRAAAAGLSWPLPPELDEEALEAKLFPPLTASLSARRPVPDWRALHRELRRGRHVTLQLLWLEWREDNPDGWAYTQFCNHYKAWLGTQDVVMRLSYRPGEKMFVDFSGDRIDLVDPASGEAQKAEVFVAVLGYSGLLYVEATRGQDLASWLGAHANAYEYCGGVTEATTPDNLRSGVTKPCFYEPELNRSYLELARHYGTVILPTRVKRPRDKAAVEAGVLCAERWVLAPLRNRRFFSLVEMNKAIAEKLAELNSRAFRGEPTSRRELFEELERGALKPLPATRYELAEWKAVTANIDYHVEFDHHFYSVPYTLVRQKLELRAAQGTIEVYRSGRRVASHPREHGRRRFVTDPAHMPASHRAHLEWRPSRLVEWARTVSPSAAVLAEKMLASKPHPEHAYRACLGLMGLARRYGNERLGAACERALALGAVSYSSVKSILAQGLEHAALPARVAPSPPDHENLRGPGYYAESESAYQVEEKEA